MHKTSISGSHFKWIEDQSLGSFSGIAIPVLLQSQCLWMQLDTGLDQTILYGTESLKGLDISFQKVGSFLSAKIPANLCGCSFEERLFLRENMKPERHNGVLVKGSVGLDWLLGRIITIDFKRENIWVSSDSESLNHRYSGQVPLVIRHNKIFPEILFGNERTTKFFFDTGSCAFSLVVDYAEWKYLVNQESHAVAIERRAIDAFGKGLNAVTARISQRFQIGSFSLNSMEITYIEEYPDYFSSWPFPVRGLLGMKPFQEATFRLDLCDHSQSTLSMYSNPY